MARITKAELQQINARLAAENEALRAELSSLRGDIANGLLVPVTQTPRTERQPASNTGRRAQLNALKHFATKFRCLSRVGADGDIELFSRDQQAWISVAEMEELCA